MAGLPMHFHNASLGDVLLAAQRSPAINGRVGTALDEIGARVTDGPIRSALLPDAPWYDDWFNQERGYVCTSLDVDGEVLVTVTGAISYLKQVCILSKTIP
jgi:hypothetical protein